MTEEEASTLLCPFTLQITPNEFYCRGSECMAWEKEIKVDTSLTPHTITIDETKGKCSRLLRG